LWDASLTLQKGLQIHFSRKDIKGNLSYNVNIIITNHLKVLHGSLSTRKIFLTKNFTAKLTEFGVAPYLSFQRDEGVEAGGQQNIANVPRTCIHPTPFALT
jgi:hypothetical protein